VILLTAAGGTTLAPGGDPHEAGVDRDRVTVVLTPRREAVLSAEVSARIVAIHKDMGEPFGPDETLVQLENLAYRVNRESAAARLLAARVEFAQAEKLATERTRQRHAAAVAEAARANLAATQRLFDSGHSSQVDLANARRDVTTAEAECELVEATVAKELAKAQRELALAEGGLKMAEEELAACTIAAPYAGRVTRLLVNEHELVDRGAPVIEVVDDRVLRAKFLLPSALFREVQAGQTLRVVIDETGDFVDVRVSHIAAVLDPASVTFEVFAELDNGAGKFRAGMNGSLSLSEIGKR